MTLVKRQLPQDLYNRCTTLLYGTVDEINVALKRHCPIDHEPLHPSCRGHWRSYATGGFEADYICVVTSRSRDHVCEVLAHETLHLVSHALRMAGIAHTQETDEAYTYYQQWLIRECLKVIPGAKR